MNEANGVRAGGRLERGAPPAGYASGFGNEHASEAEKGALPIGLNNPQRAPFGLYAEQLSGTAFTAPRGANRRSWLYRIAPSVKHGVGFEELALEHWRSAPLAERASLPAMQLRWRPVEMPAAPTDFVDAIRTMTVCGDAEALDGMAAHAFAANRSMEDRIFQNADAEMMILPESGAIRALTEFGALDAKPGDILVIPRNVKFQISLLGGEARGYALENYGAALELPERGPIGANSLAESRDFLYPLAAYEDAAGEFTLLLKSGGRFFRASLSHSPLDVVAWHGNYAPYKYDLRRFTTIGSISVDHPDPSIFTVLTSPSDRPGVANIDFVIFPDRWLVMEGTFRPPWYHTNCMSEFMGLLYGAYDAKPGGFAPGAMSLHNAGLPHGPDAEAFAKASSDALAPEKLAGTMAFMFETRLRQHPTPFAADRVRIDGTYAECWSALPRSFKSPSR